jgi:DNA-3-methyladenine glycosylase II
MQQSTDDARSPRHPRSTPSRSRHEVSLVTPYRLDLTVSVLRRLSMNIVDVLTPEGQYVRAINGANRPVIARVVQPRPDALVVTIEGDAAEHMPALALVRRTLGVDRDLMPFDGAAAQIPWLSPLALRMRGVKPPRYPSLWEAFVNVIIFQQLSLQAASAIARRLIIACGPPVMSEGRSLYTFPRVDQVVRIEDSLLGAIGLSAGKIATLRRVGEALASGTLAEAKLEEDSSADAARELQQIKGIGPWTAAVILLRGLGRLDVFPMDDTSVAKNFALVAGTMPLDVAAIIDALRPQQGMLYYHLLLARLDARGEVGRASRTDGEPSHRQQRTR